MTISPKTVPQRLLTYLVLCSVTVFLQPLQGLGSSDGVASATTLQASKRDGQHDFDFEIGAWNAQLSRLLHPLAASKTWVDYEGTSVVRKVWSGRANLGELEVAGPSGRIQGLSLRLYDPQARQWHISWANSSDGVLGQPMTGEFKDGRGEFFDQEVFNGRAIYVRFVFSDITPSSFRFEQAFSDDGGKTWEVNWKAAFTR